MWWQLHGLLHVKWACICFGASRWHSEMRRGAHMLAFTCACVHACICVVLLCINFFSNLQLYPKSNRPAIVAMIAHYTAEINELWISVTWNVQVFISWNEHDNKVHWNGSQLNLAVVWMGRRWAKAVVWRQCRACRYSWLHISLAAINWHVSCRRGAPTFCALLPIRAVVDITWHAAAEPTTRRFIYCLQWH